MALSWRDLPSIKLAAPGAFLKRLPHSAQTTTAKAPGLGTPDQGASPLYHPHGSRAIPSHVPPPGRRATHPYGRVARTVPE